jgi:hypothetical protein
MHLFEKEARSKSSAAVPLNFVAYYHLIVQGDKNETSRKEREVRCQELREVAAVPALTWLAQVRYRCLPAYLPACPLACLPACLPASLPARLPKFDEIPDLRDSFVICLTWVFCCQC